MIDPTLIQEVVRRGQEADHYQCPQSKSPRRESDSSSSSSRRQQRPSQDNSDLRGIIQTKDMCNWIKIHQQNRDQAEQEQHNKIDYDLHSPYYDQPARYRSLERARDSSGIKLFSCNLRKVIWSPNFKPSTINKYDGSTNLTEWLEVYQLAIEAVGGDSYIMANYLSIYLSSSARTSLLGHSTGFVWSWSDLCRQLISNFRVACERPRVKWDLANIVQKEGESLQEFIQHFCNKRLVALEVDNKSIIIFYKKGLKDSALVRKLAMKNPRMSEEMLGNANKYALMKEATLDTREAKKDKPSHMDWPGTSKSNDKKRKHDCSIANVEQPHHNRTGYWPRSGKYEHKTKDCNRLQGFADKVLKSAKKVNQEKKIVDMRSDFPEARKEVNYIYSEPDSYESKRKKKLTARVVMAVGLTTPEYLKCFEVPIIFD
jgi:hypothetical protein